jgi:hypothetical protein
VATPGGTLIFDSPDHPINYHLAFAEDGAPVNWPQAARRPRVAERCGSASAPALSVISPMDVVESLDEGEISTAPFCGASVIIGATSEIARDAHLSPYGLMPGALIFANAARGVDLSGPLRRFPFWYGLIVVMAITVVVFFAYEAVHSLSGRLLGNEPKTTASKMAHWVTAIVAHPITVSFLITNILFLAGLALTFFAIREGYWGVFAAPALAASLSNAFDDVNGMRKTLLALNWHGR